MTRRNLPNRRPGLTFDVEHGTAGDRFTVTIGGDGATGDVVEVFITAPKIGSDVQATARDAAILVSLALQFGCPLATIAHALTRDDSGRPASIVGSVVEAIAGMSGPQLQVVR